MIAEPATTATNKNNTNTFSLRYLISIANHRLSAAFNGPDKV